MTDAVLALNAGSSSLKFAVYRDVSGKIAPVSKGEIEGIGTAPHFVARDADGRRPDRKALAVRDVREFAR
jgi:acetate kinase